MENIFRNISSDEELKELSQLAHKVWNVHYPPIIGRKQTDYMLDKMYSLESLKKQIETDKCEFTSVYVNGIMAGFISVSRTGDKDYFIHKLYVDTDIQRRGLGNALIDHVFKDKDYETIRLTVNRQNVKAVNFYFKFGFVIEKIIDMDIGEGYYMNDFVMVFSK